MSIKVELYISNNDDKKGNMMLKNIALVIAVIVVLILMGVGAFFLISSDIKDNVTKPYKEAFDTSSKENFIKGCAQGKTGPILNFCECLVVGLKEKGILKVSHDITQGETIKKYMMTPEGLDMVQKCKTTLHK